MFGAWHWHSWIFRMLSSWRTASAAFMSSCHHMQKWKLTHQEYVGDMKFVDIFCISKRPCVLIPVFATLFLAKYESGAKELVLISYFLDLLSMLCFFSGWVFMSKTSKTCKLVESLDNWSLFLGSEFQGWVGRSFYHPTWCPCSLAAAVSALRFTPKLGSMCLDFLRGTDFGSCWVVEYYNLLAIRGQSFCEVSIVKYCEYGSWYFLAQNPAPNWILKPQLLVCAESNHRYTVYNLCASVKMLRWFQWSWALPTVNFSIAAISWSSRSWKTDMGSFHEDCSTFFPSHFSRQLRLRLRPRKIVGNITLYQYHLNSVVFQTLGLKKRKKPPKVASSCSIKVFLWKDVGTSSLLALYLLLTITSSTNQLRHSTPPEELFLRMQAPQGGGDTSHQGWVWRCWYVHVHIYT